MTILIVGDIKKTKGGKKDNNTIAKLIYVHEGIESEALQSTRNRLINPYYFSRTAEGCSNEELWDEVYRYTKPSVKARNRSF